MATKARRRAENGTGVRTKVVGVRFDPKLRYLAEMGARKQRRSLSSFIETAVEESLNRVVLEEASEYNGNVETSLADQASELWDVDDAERFARLAILYEELLTHEEQVLWKLIKDSNLLSWGKSTSLGSREWDWDELERFVFPQLRENWTFFQKVANGEASFEELPRWNIRPPPDPETGAISLNF